MYLCIIFSGDPCWVLRISLYFLLKNYIEFSIICSLFFLQFSVEQEQSLDIVGVKIELKDDSSR